MKHGWFRHKNAICIFGFLFLQLHCKKSSSDNPPPPTPPISSNSACASGLAALTFEATPTLPTVDPRTLKTQNTALQLADTGNGTYTKFQLSCDTDPNAEVIRWKACAVSSSAGCYPKDQEWSVMFECGDLPSLQELQGQVVRFTVQSCIPQHRDQVRIQNHQSVDANELSCESPGQEFIFKLPSNFSDYNAKYASVMDELYGLNQKYMDIGKQIYAASKEPADAAANAASTGLALAGGATDASLKSVVQTKANTDLPQWAKSFRNAGPYMVGYLAAYHDAVSSEAANEVQEDQATINAGQTPSLSLASTDSLSSCAGAISSLNDTPVDTSTQTTPPPVFTPASASTPQDTVTDTAWGPNTCQVDQEWNGASNTCVNRCATGQTWNDAQGTCDSPTTDTGTKSNSDPAKRGGLIFAGAAIATIGLVVLLGTKVDGLRSLSNKWDYTYKIKGKIYEMQLMQEDFTLDTGFSQHQNIGESEGGKKALQELEPGNQGLTERVKTGTATKEDLTKVQEKIVGKDINVASRKETFERLQTEMEPFQAKDAGSNLKFDNKIKMEKLELENYAHNTRKATFKNSKNEFKNLESKAEFKPSEAGKWLARLGGVLILAGVILAVVAALTQLAGDTGGVAGYAQNLADIDQKTFDLGDQVLLQSAQLDAILAAEKSAKKAH